MSQFCKFLKHAQTLFRQKINECWWSAYCRKVICPRKISVDLIEGALGVTLKNGPVAKTPSTARAHHRMVLFPLTIACVGKGGVGKNASFSGSVSLSTRVSTIVRDTHICVGRFAIRS